MPGLSASHTCRRAKLSILQRQLGQWTSAPGGCCCGDDSQPRAGSLSDHRRAGLRAATATDQPRAGLRAATDQPRASERRSSAIHRAGSDECPKCHRPDTRNVQQCCAHHDERT